jgi:FixJ family two-component response regulator
MAQLAPLISIVDDDESVRESLPDLLKEFGFASRAFASAQEFLESDAPEKAACLILDITMPGMSGPELWRELKRRGINIPVLFITALRNEGLRSRLIEEGAVGCLVKPFTDTVLLRALSTVLRIP